MSDCQLCRIAAYQPAHHLHPWPQILLAQLVWHAAAAAAGIGVCVAVADLASSFGSDIFMLLAQFYGLGLFGTPPVAWAGGPYAGWAGAARRAAFALPTLMSAGMDQPLRTLSGGACSSH